MFVFVQTGGHDIGPNEKCFFVCLFCFLFFFNFNFNFNFRTDEAAAGSCRYLNLHSVMTTFRTERGFREDLGRCGHNFRPMQIDLDALAQVVMHIW